MAKAICFVIGFLMIVLLVLIYFYIYKGIE